MKIIFSKFRELCGVEPLSYKSYCPMRGKHSQRTCRAAVTLLTLCTRTENRTRITRMKILGPNR